MSTGAVTTFAGIAGGGAFGGDGGPATAAHSNVIYAVASMPLVTRSSQTTRTIVFEKSLPPQGSLKRSPVTTSLGMGGTMSRLHQRRHRSLLVQLLYQTAMSSLLIPATRASARSKASLYRVPMDRRRGRGKVARPVLLDSAPLDRQAVSMGSPSPRTALVQRVLRGPDLCDRPVTIETKPAFKTTEFNNYLSRFPLRHL